MNLLEWKSVNLYKLLPAIVAKKYENLNKKIRFLCCNANYKVFTDNRNTIYIFSNNWECHNLGTPMDSFKFAALTEGPNLLVLMDQNVELLNIELKVYNLNKLPLNNESIEMVASASLLFKSKATALSSKMCYNLLCIAIGLENGSILLHRAPIAQLLNRNFRQWHICGQPIREISILCDGIETNTLLICSEMEIFCYLAHNTNLNKKSTLDNVRSVIHCSCMQDNFNSPADDEKRYYAVACDDAIYCYKTEGRALTYTIGGQKKLMRWFGRHLFIVLQQQEDNEENDVLIIADTKNHIIVFKVNLKNIDVILAGPEKFTRFIIMRERHVLSLHELELETQLKLLFQKNMYDIAFGILDEQLTASEDRNIGDFYLEYADHLLLRGDSEGALNLYIKTIGKVSPYKVFGKLIALRSNDYLLNYLHALEQSDVSSEYADLIYCCHKRVNMQINTNDFFQKIRVQQTINSDKANNDINQDAANIKTDLQLLTQNYINMYFPSKANRQLITFQKFLLEDRENLPKFFKEIKKDDMVEFIRQYGRYFLVNNDEIQHKIIDGLLDENGEMDELVINALLPNVLKDRECSLYLLVKIMENHRYCHLNSIVHTLRLNILLQRFDVSNSDPEPILNKMRKMLAPNNLEIVLIENILVLCGRYKFWEGIKLIMDNVDHKITNALQPLLRWNGTCHNPNFNDNKLNIMWHTYHLQCKRGTNQKHQLSANDASKFLNNLLQTVMKSSPDLLLKILERMANSDDFYSWHINQIFLKTPYCPFINNRTLHKEVRELQSQMENYKSKLSDYQQKPIEFRSNSCNICMQSLHLPAVYYLCQHAFHKKCLAPYGNDTNCVTCKALHKSSNLYQQGSSNNSSPHSNSKTQIQNEFASTDNSNTLMIKQVSSRLNLYISHMRNANSNIKPKPRQIVLNPFENSSDNESISSNPFVTSSKSGRNYL